MTPRPDFRALALAYGNACAPSGIVDPASLVSLLEQVEHNALERAAEEADAAAGPDAVPADVHRGYATRCFRRGADLAVWRIRRLKRGGRP